MSDEIFTRNRTTITGLVLGIVIGVMVAWGLSVILPWRAPPTKLQAAGATTHPGKLFGAPQFSGLENQLGEAVSSKDFKGKVQLVTFIYPDCEGPCAILASRMVNLEKLIEKRGLEKRIALISINLDPSASLGKIRQFIEQYGGNPGATRWQILTGDQKTISALVRQGYHANYKKEKIMDDGGQVTNQPIGHVLPRMQNPLADVDKLNYRILHSQSAAVVGPRGEVRYVIPKAYMVSEAEMLNDIIRTLHNRKGA